MKSAVKKNTVRQAMIDLPNGSTAPDVWEGAPGETPPPDFVVSRDREGRPLSRYGDPSWDYSQYHPRGKWVRFNFIPWDKEPLSRNQKRLVAEMRWVVFCLIWKRSGSSLSVSTLRSSVGALRNVLVFAHHHGYSLVDVLSEAKVLRELIYENPSRAMPHQLSAIISALIATGAEELGFTPLGGRSLIDLRALKLQYAKTCKQHPPLPVRIYSRLIANANAELAEIAASIDSLLKVVCQTTKWLEKFSNKVGCVDRKQTCTGETKVVRSLIQRNGLVAFFQARSLTLNRFGLMTCLSDIQMTCQYILHIYSGARADEIRHVPYDCIERRREYGRTNYLLHGTTTKLNGGRPKAAHWVTSEEGVQAVLVAKKLADVIYRYLGVRPGHRGQAGEYALFVSVSYLPFYNRKIVPDFKRTRFMASNTKRTPEGLLTRLLPLIEKQDLEDLNRIDPHRAWASEDRFKPGQRWHLTTHQLRRSLALYASSSGIVTLPSLRRQLQHITEAMSRYYARGSEFAKAVIGGNKKHFGYEYQQAQSESQTLAYVAAVLFSDEPLFGAHGTFVDRQKQRKGGIRIRDQREKTIRLFRKGQLAYKETLLGGCMESRPCAKRAMRSIVGCVDCKKAVLKASKVRRVVGAQEALVASLDPGSVEYRTETHDLEILTATLQKMEGDRDQSTTSPNRGVPC